MLCSPGHNVDSFYGTFFCFFKFITHMSSSDTINANIPAKIMDAMEEAVHKWLYSYSCVHDGRVHIRPERAVSFIAYLMELAEECPMCKDKPELVQELLQRVQKLVHAEHMEAYETLVNMSPNLCDVLCAFSKGKTTVNAQTRLQNVATGCFAFLKRR